MIARTLPAFVFGPIAGSFVDRLNRKQIMIIADIGRAGLYLSMAFLNRLWAIYLLSFVIECLSLLWSPARDASLPNIVPRRQLANANSLVLVSAYATLPIGGAAFAVLVGVSKSLSARIPILASQPESLALVFDAATFLFSAAMVAGITLRSTAVTEHEGLDMSRVWRDTRDGLRFLREDSIAAAMTGRASRSRSAPLAQCSRQAPCSSRRRCTAGSRGGGSSSPRSASAWRSGW